MESLSGAAKPLTGYVKKRSLMRPRCIGEELQPNPGYCQILNYATGTDTSVSPLHMEFTKMNCEQRIRIIEEKLTAQGVTINEWAKRNELDHRIVDDLIKGNLRGTHGIALNARKKMEEFFGQIFDS